MDVVKRREDLSMWAEPWRSQHETHCHYVSNIERGAKGCVEAQVCMSPYRNFIRFEQYLCVDCSETEGVMQLEVMRGR